MLLTLGLCVVLALGFAGCGSFSSRAAAPPGPARV